MRRGSLRIISSTVSGAAESPIIPASEGAAGSTAIESALASPVRRSRVDPSPPPPPPRAPPPDPQAPRPHPFFSSPSSPSIAPTLRDPPDSLSCNRHRRRRRPAPAVATRPRLPPANIPSSHWSGAGGAGSYEGAGPRGGPPPAAVARRPPSSALQQRFFGEHAPHWVVSCRGTAAFVRLSPCFFHALAFCLEYLSTSGFPSAVPESSAILNCHLSLSGIEANTQTNPASYTLLSSTLSIPRCVVTFHRSVFPKLSLHTRICESSDRFPTEIVRSIWNCRTEISLGPQKQFPQQKSLGRKLK